MADDFAYPKPWIVQRAEPPSDGNRGFLALWSDAHDYGVAVYCWCDDDYIRDVCVEHWAGNKWDNRSHEMAVEWTREQLRDSLINGEIAEIIKQWRNEHV